MKISVILPLIQPMKNLKSIAKLILPEIFKESLRKIEDSFRRLAFGFNYPTVLTDINELRFIFYPDQKDHIRWLRRRGEQQIEFSAMKSHLRPGQTAFDVGANIGTVSSFMAKHVTQEGEVHSFEPFPESYRRLKENTTLNNFNHVICNEIGLSDKITSTELFYDTLHPGLNSLGQMKDSALNQSVTVQLDTIDNYCQHKNILHIHVLKIDVEGFELDVLKGANRMLETKAIDFIQFELSSDFLARFGKKPKTTFDYLSSVGYKVFDFDEKRNIFVGPLTRFEMGCKNYYSSYDNLSTHS